MENMEVGRCWRPCGRSLMVGTCLGVPEAFCASRPLQPGDLLVMLA